MNQKTLREKRFKMTAIASFLLFINIMLFMSLNIRKKGLSGLTTMDWTLCIILLCLGIIAPFAVKYKFNILTKSNEPAPLVGEYALVFQDIKDYISMSRIPKRDKKEIFSDIYDILKEGSENNRPIEDIVGKDYKVFVQEVFEVYDNTHLKLIDLMTGIQFLVGYLLSFKLFYYFESGMKEGFYKQGIPGGLIFFFSIVSMVSLPYLYRYFRSLIKTNIKDLIVSILGIVIPSILMLFNNSIFGDESQIVMLMETDIVLFSSSLQIGIGLLIILGVFFLKNHIYAMSNK